GAAGVPPGAVVDRDRDPGRFGGAVGPLDLPLQAVGGRGGVERDADLPGGVGSDGSERDPELVDAGGLTGGHVHFIRARGGERDGLVAFEAPARGLVLGEVGLAGFEVLAGDGVDLLDRKSTRLNSSHVKISYAVF